MEKESVKTFKQPLLSNKMDYFVNQRASWDGTQSTRILSFEQFYTNNDTPTYLEVFPDGYSTICFEITPKKEVRACYFGKMIETKLTFYAKENTYFAIKISPNLLFTELINSPKFYINRVTKLSNYTPVFDSFDYNRFAVLSFQERITYFQAYVRQHLPYYENKIVNEVLQAANNMEKSPKLITIAEEIGVSDRYIRSVFQKEIGISPKKMIQFIRFKHTLKEVMSNSRSLTDVYMNTTFYDQSHLNKFFKSFTTYSPKEIKKLIH